MRMLHESTSYRDKCFTTLTYDDQHLPNNASLVKRDLQLYHKRVRKALDPHRMRYFSCGEYGDQTDRPHYHSIYFGIGLNRVHQRILQDCWPYGHIKSGTVTPESIRYVAQYIDKKYSGDLAEEVYTATGREPVFRISSLGLGRDFCDAEAEQLKQNLYVTLNGVQHSLPRYYIKRLGINIAELETVAKERDCEVVEHYTGLYISSDDLYKHGNTDDVRSLIDSVQSAKDQHDKNLKARVSLKTKKL